MFLGKFQDVRIKLVHQGFHCFSCCPEVVKINELSFVFKSLEKKNFGACRSSDSSNAAPTIGSIKLWRQLLHKLPPDGKYLMLSYQNLMLKTGWDQGWDSGKNPGGPDRRGR